MELPVFDTSWILTIICVIILTITFRSYFNISNSYWIKRGIPYIARKPFIGSAIIFGTKTPHLDDMKRYRKYGRMIGTYEGQQPVLILGDPELIRHVWIKDFPVFPGRRSFISGDPIGDNMISAVTGEKWKRIRCIISPAFSTGKIKRMTDIILSSAQTLAQNFASKDGTLVDAKKFFNTFTMDVIASAAFATKIHSYQDPNNQFLKKASLVFTNKIQWKFLVLFLFPKLFKRLNLRAFNVEAMEFFKGAVMEIIEHRTKTGTVRNDFLQLLMDAEKEFQEQEKTLENGKKMHEDEDDKAAKELGHEEHNAEYLRAPKVVKALSHNELIAQCVIFFLAGYETTASTLTLATRLLALNPDIQDKLRDEVDAVLKNYDGKLTYDGVQDMKYLDCVLSETLRFYPPAFRLERLAEADYELGDTGVTIEKGTLIAVPLYAIHHDPEFYEDPEKFDPDRFSPEEKNKRHPYCYLPFGAGPRNCIAMRFALMEVKVCLAYVISQFNIVASEETKELKIFSGAGLLQPSNVLMKFEKRPNRVFEGC